MNTEHCMASAISAGLGAMTFRNHLRSLTEISDKAKSRLKTAGKIGAGALAAGGAAYAGYKNQESIKGAGKAVWKKMIGEKEGKKLPRTGTGGRDGGETGQGYDSPGFDGTANERTGR